ncbi:MAG TPA: hypothetical protein VLM37_01680, partial [Fibrobacteraceae bacterium]|nr:hypothetical protein [Fibrobacteraceae bacterium]
IRREVWRSGKRIDGIHVQEDCYFLLCLKGRECLDSRESGFVPRRWISGIAREKVRTRETIRPRARS